MIGKVGFIFYCCVWCDRRGFFFHLDNLMVFQSLSIFPGFFPLFLVSRSPCHLCPSRLLLHHSLSGVVGIGLPLVVSCLLVAGYWLVGFSLNSSLRLITVLRSCLSSQGYLPSCPCMSWNLRWFLVTCLLKMKIFLHDTIWYN